MRVKAIYLPWMFCVCLLLTCCSSQPKKSYETNCISSVSKKSEIYKELTVLLKSHEADIEKHYPHNEENLLQNGNQQDKDNYDRLIAEYKKYDKDDEDNCSKIIAEKYNLSRTCLYSIWWEGTQRKVEEAN